MYWDIPGPQALNLVGTAYQSIGMGLASAVGAGAAAGEGETVVLASGDGGFLMGLADLESVVRSVRSGVIVIYNDAGYGAEVHQYGSIGLHEEPMLIPEVDFAAVARGLGAESTKVRSLEDLAELRQWVADGANGVFLVDCRISADGQGPVHGGSPRGQPQGRPGPRLANNPLGEGARLGACICTDPGTFLFHVKTFWAVPKKPTKR